MSEYAINLRSCILAGPTDLSVIVPSPKIGGSAKEFYDSNKKYKVLWLLHAGSGDRNDWLRGTSIGRFVEDREVIVVIPKALDGDFANHPEFADGYNFSDFFFDEIMPYIHYWFPASDQQKDNFIAGFSMRAAGAWMYGLYRPDRFGGVALIASPPKNFAFLEPHRNLASSEFRTRPMADRMVFPTGYGNLKSGIHVKEINIARSIALRYVGSVGNGLYAGPYPGGSAARKSEAELRGMDPLANQYYSQISFGRRFPGFLRTHVGSLPRGCGGRMASEHTLGLRLRGQNVSKSTSV
jgi:pimeloyl-ACP methyl ester carboxylesterase